MIRIASVDRKAYESYLAAAERKGRDLREGQRAFCIARAAMAGVLVGRQKARDYADDRRRGFAAALRVAFK